jgi:predicted ATPase/class 3 adenylate cyclase
MDSLPTGTVTFLFTDIEGSTKLWGQYPEAMKAALARHDALLRAAIEAQGGYVFKTVGDAFCAAFNTATEAMIAAVAAQRALHAEAWGQTGEVRVRMALHTGAAEEREGDYFGPPLNRVARLLSTGFGGQILLSLTTAELVRDHLPEGASLQDLGEHRLKDLVRPEQIFQLTVPDLPSRFPSLKSLDTLPNNLPVQLTSFVGREREMEEVKRLLSQARLVTLLGPGGTGKTRLSLQVAAELLDAFADGVWLVELAPLADPQLVPQTVATVLGVREEPGQPLLTTLATHLRDKQALLVLDNCEHLVAASAQAAEALLRGCPRLRLLASSREALGIGGETSFPVPPLSLPDAQHLPSIDSLTQYEAVRLFLDRAMAVLPAFAATNQNAPALAQVCHRLDGIPLAIELAAARVKVLSVEQIAVRLDDRFRLLTGGSRTAQRRQQTLRAAIDWSYDLLSEPERTLLRRLAVFAGGWTLEAAETVCADEGLAGDEVLDLLAQLVDKSLVMVGEEVRYRLLETIRQYAQEKLVEAGEAEEVRGRHLEVFAKLAEQVEPDLAVRLMRLETEHDNLRAALEWCRSGQESAEMGQRLGAALGPFWYARGYWHEGRAQLEAVLAREAAAGRTAARATALLWAGNLARLQGDDAAARVLYEESLAINRELGNRRGIAGSLWGLGIRALYQGELATARALYEESLAIYRELGNKEDITGALNGLGEVFWRQGAYEAARVLFEESLEITRTLGNAGDIAWAHFWLGNVAMSLGDTAAARAHLEENLALQKKLGEKQGIGWALNSLGLLARYQKNYAMARTRFEEGLTINRALESKLGIAWSLNGLGYVFWRQGEPVQAMVMYREFFAEFANTGDKRCVAMGLECLAEMAGTQGQPVLAARLFGAAETLREANGEPLWPVERSEYERNVAAVRAQLSEAGFAATWAEGRAMTLGEAVAYALREAGREG